MAKKKKKRQPVPLRKQCSGPCGEVKPITEFYRCGRWRQRACRDCANAQRAEWNRLNPEVVKAANARQTEVRKHDPLRRERQRARGKLSWAIKSGRVIVPDACEGCGDCHGEELHGHHEDYSKPLDAIFLCSKCHGLAHRREAV